MKNNKSFSTRLSLNILLLTSILFLAAIVVASISSHKLIAEEATKSAENLLDATISKIENSLQRVEFAAEASSWLVNERKDNDSYLYHITREIVSENDNIVGSAIAFAPDYKKGKHAFSPYSYKDLASGEIISKDLGESYDYFVSEWFKKSYESGEGSWSEPYYDEGGAEYMMSTYSFPVRDDEGQIIAIITADITLDWLNSIIAEIRPYERSFVSLLSHDGKYINSAADTSTTGPDVYSTLDSMSGNEYNMHNLVGEMMSGKKGNMTYAVGNNISFAVYGPLENGWVASISCDYRDVLKRTSKMQLILFLIGIGGLIFLFLLCYLTVRKLTRPLKEISSAALSVAGGNFNTVLPEIKSKDEIRALKDSFEYMQKSLNSYMEDLKVSTSQNERYESELTIASKIQMAMVPTNFSKHDKVDLYAMLKPAREVGGDLYDFYIKDNTLYFAIGDVSGKGMPASMFMAITRSAFHFISGLGLSIDQILGKINNSICDGNNTGMFVTLFVGKINLETREFLYCNAGHNPILINGEYLKAEPNIACGIISDFNYKMQSLTLDEKSTIILYTDGVTEAEKVDKELFGEGRLKEYFHSLEDGTDSKEICENLLETVRDYTEDNVQNDDITIMTIKLK